MKRVLGILLMVVSFLYSETTDAKENIIEKKELKKVSVFEKELENKKNRENKLKLEIEKLKQSLYKEDEK